MITELAKLKKLKHLFISNNVTLNVEELINVISQELPKLEVLEIYNCNTLIFPKNIHLLAHLKLVIIDGQCINTGYTSKEKEKKYKD